MTSVVLLPFPLAGRRVFVAGHRGMVGSAIVRRLAREDCLVLTAPRAELDLTDGRAVDDWFDAHRPEVVVLAAARVGGILANDSRPVDFLHDNLMIQGHVLAAAARTDVGRLLFLGSSCIYPRLAPQPIAEESLLTGPLEPTNEAYALAKIAGIKLVDAHRRQFGRQWISAMPTNLYGPNDNFDADSSHVLPALIRKAHEAKLAGRDGISIWGTGTPRREFLHVDDLADACVFLMTRWSDAGPINVGTGRDIAIAELARLVCEVVGVAPIIATDPSKPDGTPRKLLDVGRLTASGWTASIGLREGVADAYAAFLEGQATARPLSP